MVIILFNLAAFYVYMESLVLYVCKCVLLFVYVCVGACTFNLCVIVSFLHVHVIVQRKHRECDDWIMCTCVLTCMCIMYARVCISVYLFSCSMFLEGEKGILRFQKSPLLLERGGMFREHKVPLLLGGRNSLEDERTLQVHADLHQLLLSRIGSSGRVAQASSSSYIIRASLSLDVFLHHLQGSKGQFLRLEQTFVHVYLEVNFSSESFLLTSA